MSEENEIAVDICHENEIVGITYVTMERLLKEGRMAVDLIALMNLYSYMAKRQGTNCILCTWNHTMEKLGITKGRLSAAKKRLTELGLIEQFQKRSEKAKFAKNYIRVRYLVRKLTKASPEASSAQEEAFLSDKQIAALNDLENGDISTLANWGGNE